MLLLGLRSATDYTAQAGYPGMESVAMIIQTVRTDKGPLSLVYIALGAWSFGCADVEALDQLTVGQFK